MSPFEMTEEFYQTFDPTRPEQPRPFTPEKAGFRAGFKVEELVEFLYAAANNDPRAVRTVSGGCCIRESSKQKKRSLANKTSDGYVSRASRCLMRSFCISPMALFHYWVSIRHHF